MPIIPASHYLHVGLVIKHLIQSKISPSPHLPPLIHFSPQGGEWGGDRLKGLDQARERQGDCSHHS